MKRLTICIVLWILATALSRSIGKALNRQMQG